MKYSKKFNVNTAFKVEKFDNEILLYAVSSSRGVYLNETAYLVWEMCANGHSIEKIITLLREAYPLQRESIHKDVVATIESLLDNGVLIADDD